MTPTLIAFDTVAPVLGVAVWREGHVFEETARIARGSEQVLLPMAERLLERAGAALTDVGAVAVATGPGAFTGLRVGLATAAGLAQALAVPLVPGPSFLGRGLGAPSEGFGVVMLDARKQRVYAQCWRDGEPCGPGADVAPDVAVSSLECPFWATGEGALVYRDVVEAAGGRVLDTAEAPGAGNLAGWAVRAWRRGEGIRPEEVRPQYIREPDAVTKRREGT